MLACVWKFFYHTITVDFIVVSPGVGLLPFLLYSYRLTYTVMHKLCVYGFSGRILHTAKMVVNLYPTGYLLIINRIFLSLYIFPPLRQPDWIIMHDLLPFLCTKYYYLRFLCVLVDYIIGSGVYCDHIINRILVNHMIFCVWIFSILFSCCIYHIIMVFLVLPCYCWSEMEIIFP